jgi:hypothetical protein
MPTEGKRQQKKERKKWKSEEPGISLMDLIVRHCDLFGGDRGEFMVSERQRGEPLF